MEKFLRSMSEKLIELTVWEGEKVHRLQVKHGISLRDALLTHGLSPYGPYTQQLNCKGNGICATCGITPLENVPSPRHWHDKLAARYGYPRLACQIRVEAPMSIGLIVDKGIWE
ncbi:MAG: 2Fe-2S iron-sulfur cluster binding domain-containing protein [Bacteroidota bacterium]